MRKSSFFVFAAIVIPLTLAAATPAADPEVQAFLDFYNTAWEGMDRVANEAAWKAQADISEEHSAAAAASIETMASFMGNGYVMKQVRRFQERGAGLPYIQRAQLERIRLAAAGNPGTIPQVVHDKIEAETRLSDTLYGHEFTLADGQGGPKVVSPNDIDEALRRERSLDKRLLLWEASKTVGPVVKPGLVGVRDLRNRVATEVGATGYFDLQVQDYGMTTPEMMGLMDQAITDLRPLYVQLHCWAKYRLAERYGVPKSQVGAGIPAHWLPNRWAQEWPGLVDAVDLDPLVKNKKPEELVHLAEDFYVSMGFPKLPPSFWEKSDLWDLPVDSPRKKNKHASAWNMDRREDVRSLMSVRPDFEWLSTTHHELGHIYYYLSYNRDEVPPTLREGANRAFHEAIGELAALVTAQPTYLRQRGLLPAKWKTDNIQWLLNDATNSIVFLPFAAGTMAHWEHDIYETKLPADQWNQRWWSYVAKYQGVVPPSPRDEQFCDPCTKTHVVDDPAGYYDYALATVIKLQIHDHVARNILKVDPRDASYYGNKAVGTFLRSILAPGATRDWRELLRDATGSDLTAKPMLEYYRPLLTWLQKQNKGCDCKMPE